MQFYSLLRDSPFVDAEQFSVYWFDPEPTKGSETRKIRPCIVVSPDVMNSRLNTVVVVPLTSTVQPWPFRLTLSVLGQESSAACDQIRSVDKSRLKELVSALKPSDARALTQLLHTIFAE